MQHPPQNLPVDLILSIDLGIVLIHSEQFDHVKASFGLIQGNCENVESLVVVVGGENRQVAVEHLDDEFGDVGSLPLLLLRFLNEQGKHPIEGFDQLPWIKNHLFAFAQGCRKRRLSRLGRRAVDFR